MTKNKSILVEELLYQNSQVEHSKYVPEEKKFNKTSSFLLPMLGMSKRSKWLSMFFVNAFLDDRGIEHDFMRPLFMLLKTKSFQNKDFQEFTHAVKTRQNLQENYITDYYVGQDLGHELVMYVFQIPEKFKQDYELLREGRYSECSLEYKNLFPQTITASSGEKQESLIWSILTKSATVKDLVTKEFINPWTSTVEDVITLRRAMEQWPEVWDTFITKEETFRYDANKLSNITSQSASKDTS